jgi:predicted dehydrogenase
MLKNESIRFGIIGCGAITEKAYLPCFKKDKSLVLTCMVDENTNRALFLSKGLNLSYVGQDAHALHKYCDAVIVAVPNHLHFPLCADLLNAKKHVLCEKPLTTVSEQCNELSFLANRSNVKLAVAHVRRFYRMARIIKSIVDSRELGELRSFDFEEGTIFNWPSHSGFIFDKNRVGGGVLMDTGVHILDLLLWWHPYEIDSVNYQDDNLGGIEAYSKLHMVFSSGVEGKVTISRLSVLKNRYKLVFDDGIVEMDPVTWDPLVSKKIYVTKFSRRVKKLIKIKRELPTLDLLFDFESAVRYDKDPLVSGEDGLKVIKLIERCYRSRKLLPLEWLISTPKS